MSKMFPIQGGSPVPWEVAEEAYIVYAKRYGNRQSLERLAERGGFSVGEMDEFYPGWRPVARRIRSLETLCAAWKGAALAQIALLRRDYENRQEAREHAKQTLESARKLEEGEA